MSQITSACGFAYRRHFYSNFIPCASFFSSICRCCLRSISVILWRSVCEHRLFNKLGQTPAIVLRGGCPYLFHCLRFQPQGEPDFLFYRFHFPFFPTSFRPRNKTVSDIAARHRRDFRNMPKPPRKQPFRSALPNGVTPPRTRTTPRLSPASAHQVSTPSHGFSISLSMGVFPM